MAFTIFQNTTIIDADQVNDNFYWIGQGNFLPRGGASLDATSALYDLGSSSYKWNNIYCNNISCGTQSGLGVWNIISDTVLSANSTLIDITGLNGDVSVLYYIRATFVCNTNTVMKIGLNNDSTTNYCNQLNYYDAVGGHVTARYTSSAMLCYALTRTKATYTIYNFDGLLYAKTGQSRMMLSLNGNYYSTSSQRPSILCLCEAGQMWNNQVETITSMQFSMGDTNGLAAGTSVKIWAMR